MATMGPFQTALRNDFKLQLEVHIRAAHNRFHNPKMPNREGEISPQTKLLLEIYVWLGGAAIVCLGSTPKHDEEGVVDIGDAENAYRIADLRVKTTGQTGIFPDYTALCFGDPDGEHRCLENGPQADNTVGDPATEQGLEKKSRRGNPALPIYFAFGGLEGAYRICDWISMGTWEIVPSAGTPATVPLSQSVAVPVVVPTPALGTADDGDLIDLSE